LSSKYEFQEDLKPFYLKLHSSFKKERNLSWDKKLFKSSKKKMNFDVFSFYEKRFNSYEASTEFPAKIQSFKQSLESENDGTNFFLLKKLTMCISSEESDSKKVFILKSYDIF
jgi:hypothetical protein